MRTTGLKSLFRRGLRALLAFAIATAQVPALADDFPPGYDQIKIAGTAQNRRGTINILSGATAADDPTNDETEVTVTASGAPDSAEYVVTEANGSLSAEVAPSAANQIPNSTSSTAGSWTATPTIGGTITADGLTVDAGELITLGAATLQQVAAITDTVLSDDLLLSDAHPFLGFRDTTDNSSVYLHFDDADTATGPFSIIQGTHTGSAFTLTRTPLQMTTTGVFVLPNPGSLQLGKGNVDGSLSLNNAASTGTFLTTFLLPSGQTSALNFTLPPTDGNSGDVVQTDGNGVLTFVAAGASALSAITAATGANSINNGDNAQTWNWSMTSASGLTLGESSASSGGNILKIATLSGSSAVPLRISNTGSEDSLIIESGQGNGNIIYNQANGGGGVFDFRSTNGTIASPTDSADGDDLGVVSFQGMGNSAIVQAAKIRVFVDGTPGASDMPGSMEFSTTPDGSGTTVERLKITPAGVLNFGATGVSFTQDGDGALTIKSISSGSAEDLTLNLDDTANTGVYSSSTGLVMIDWGAIGADYDSAGTFSVPAGTNPTSSANGQVSIDTSSGAGGGLRIYSGAGYTLPAYQTKSFVITNPSATSDYSIWKAPYNITIRAIHVLCTAGTNIIGGLDEADANGANVSAIDSDITGTAGTNANDDGTLTNPTVDSADYLNWHTTSISGVPTSVTVTFEYTADQVS